MVLLHESQEISRRPEELKLSEFGGTDSVDQLDQLDQLESAKFPLVGG